MSGLIWIQTFRHYGAIPENFLWKRWFWEKSADKKMDEKLPNMQRVKSIHCKVNLDQLWEIEHVQFCLWYYVTC